MKKLIFIGLVLAGCGDGNNNVMNNTTPDMAMQQQPNPDLSPACVGGTPASNEDFLNACTTSASVEIVPFYPDKAPGGTLPPLQ